MLPQIFSSLLIIQLSHLGFVGIHAVESGRLGGGLFILENFFGNAEESPVRERGDQGSADRSEPVDPLMRPLIVPQRGREWPHRVHAGAGVRTDRRRQHGHREAELDRYRICVSLVPRICHGTEYQHQNGGGDPLEEQTLDRGQIGVQISHAKLIRLFDSTGCQAIPRCYDLAKNIGITWDFNTKFNDLK